VPASDLSEVALGVAQSIIRGPRDVILRTKAKIIARAAIGFKATLAL
jgi:hypothetical protein